MAESATILIPASLGQSPGALGWERSSEEYPAIGKVEYQYAPLAGIRKTIPGPPREMTNGPRDDQDALREAVGGAGTT